MPTQMALSFDVRPVTCEVQQRYHSIASCLAGISTRTVGLLARVRHEPLFMSTQRISVHV
jgi:hypothetical protein